MDELRIKQAFLNFLKRNRAEVKIVSSSTGNLKQLSFTQQGKTFSLPATSQANERPSSRSLY